MAVANYAEVHHHHPPAYQLGPDGRRWHSWRVLILPFIEGDSLFKRYRFDEPWDGPNNSQLAGERPRTFAFPDDEGGQVANFLAIVGANTIWPGSKPFTGQPKDEASDTILIAENHGLGVHWMEPRDLEFDSMSFELQRADGISSRYAVPAIVMADSTIRSLNPDLDVRVVRAMATAAGGERLDPTRNGRSVIEDGRERELKE